MPNVKTARNGVFISYARSDGEEFASDLRRRLEVEQIPLWQDRVGLEGGRGWWLQIKDALDRVEFMALVVTPSALNSKTVREEWRYARQQGVCVYPIKGTPDLDIDSLPRWMRKVHFYDLEHQWPKFVNDLNTRCRIPRVPFIGRDLPEGFVRRPGEFDQLIKLLIDERREEPVAITAALRGAGGYGKTTLALAVCYDKRIQEAFDDGILWVDLGQNPGQLTDKVKNLIVTLGGERPDLTDIDPVVNRLKERISDRDILIVIDDVWNSEHLKPFMQGGPRCARLITTRDFATLPASAAKVRVDAMKQEEAVALLALDLDQASFQDGRLSELTGLASRLGEWPLLLRLVNGALRHGIENENQSPRDAVTWVDKLLSTRGLTIFDADNPEHREQAVRSTIGVSLDLLKVEERERYGELAIFPEDVDIPVATLEKLWGTTGGFDEIDTELLCKRLNRFSLLWSYDANRGFIRLHDVLRKFLIDQQAEKLPSIHAQLLDAHRPAASSHWSEMSADEPYLWEHLAHHLVGAGRGNELVATVKDWRYLVAKTLIRQSLAVEADLLAAEKIASDDESLRLLRRNFVNSGHLLNRCENKDDIAVTLFSRLQHLNELKPLTRDLEQHLKRPCLIPSRMLPDLPHPALVRTLSGYASYVECCAVSSDGMTIVSDFDDATLRVWDGLSGAERFTLRGHEFGVLGCAVSADAATIVSASSDNTLKVWDGRTGAERFTLSGHVDRVTGCAVSADGAMIVSASDDQTLKVWDVSNGSERYTLRGHVGKVNGCAVSADGSMIVSASDDQTLKVWDARSGTERSTLSGHVNEVTDCAMSADGTTIVSASMDKTLKVWDGHSGAERFTLSGHAEWVRACGVSADGKIIVSTSDETLKVWDGLNGTERLVLTGHSNVVFGCAISADGTTIVSASLDCTLKVWDGRSGLGGLGTGRFTLSGHIDVNDCAVSADGTTVVSASNDQTLKMWDGRSGVERFTLRGHTGDVNGCAMSADGATVVSASNDQTLKVWDGRSGVERFTLSGHTAEVYACAMSANGATIVSSSLDETLKVWDARSGVERFTLRGHANVVSGLAVSADGTTIVSASWDHTLKVWDGINGTERFTLSGHTKMVRSCAVSADGATIVSASDDQTLKVWDGRSGVERFTLGYADEVWGCAISADGTTIVSASRGPTLKVLDSRTGEYLATLPVDGLILNCACSGDGEIIAAAGPRGVYFLRLVR